MVICLIMMQKLRNIYIQNNALLIYQHMPFFMRHLKKNTALLKIVQYYSSGR